VTLGGPERQRFEKPESPLPGMGQVRIRRVSPNDGSVELDLLGLAPGRDAKPAVPETLSIDVTTKPLIGLVWSGFYVMMFGGSSPSPSARRTRGRRRWPEFREDAGG
jgi:hypothetical protein